MVVFIKVLLIILTLFLMALPFLLELYTFKRDKERKISFKRFRVVLFALLYAILITVVLYLLKELIDSIGSIDFVQQVAKQIAISDRIMYGIDVFLAIAVNIIVGLLYVLLSKLVRIGLKKRNLVDPQGENGEYTFTQRVERAVIKFFNKEIWFFVGRVFKVLSIALGAVYAFMFIAYEVPIFFGADWIPYGLISDLFKIGYIYPSITLLVMCQISFFLLGIAKMEEECPDFEKNDENELSATDTDLETIDQRVKDIYGNFYVSDLELSKALYLENSSKNHCEITNVIASTVKNDKRNGHDNKEVYLTALDKVVSGEESLLINGIFYSEFSMYFFRYLSIILARGDNIVFVCNTDDEIDTAYEYIDQAFCEISSLYYTGNNSKVETFDHPIWKAVKVYANGENGSGDSINNASILVTSLPYLCSNDFESNYKNFIHLLDTVVFVDSLTSVNNFNKQLSMFNIRLKQIFQVNAEKSKNASENKDYKVRYMAKQVRYICFDPTQMSGLDKVLHNLLMVDFDSADCRYINPETLIRIYNYEAKPDDKGERQCYQAVSTDEYVGVIMNMAVVCLSSGASNVTVLADRNVPYQNYKETIESHKGKLSVITSDDSIRINKYHYNSNGYSVIIAMDTDNNLPAVIRRVSSLTSGDPALVYIFSREHIYRDYYIDNIDKIWDNRSFERIPVEVGTDKNLARRIAVSAASGGISTDEVLNIVSGSEYFSEEYNKKDIDGILHKVLLLHGIDLESSVDLYSHFEFSNIRDFDSNGKYVSKRNVYLRKTGDLYLTINGREIAKLKTGDSVYPLPLSAKRITQKYITGQNLLYNGNIYHINRIDIEEGSVYASLASTGKNNEAYEYIQSREYCIEAAPEKLEVVVHPSNHRLEKNTIGNVKIDNIRFSVVKAPAEVFTRGYYEVHPHLMSFSELGMYHEISEIDNPILAKQTYRRYGDLTNPTYTFENVAKSTQFVSSNEGILMMPVKITGALGNIPSKAAYLAAAMLDDLLKLMFPSVAESISVCAVVNDLPNDEETAAVLKRHSKLTKIGNSDVLTGEGLEFVIIEDSSTDLGVISGIVASGENPLYTLFKPIYMYLSWYMNTSNKSQYLYCGLDHEPICFDFETLFKLSELLGYKNEKIEHINIDTITEYHVCSFCGRSFPKSEKLTVLEDSRLICSDCVKELVGNNKKELNFAFENAKRFLESTYGIDIDDSYKVCFESTSKIIAALKKNNSKQRGSDNPVRSYIDDNKIVHVEDSIPAQNLSEILVRELTHVWQISNLPDIEEELAEGHIALVGIQYLRFLGYKTLANTRTRYYESNSNISGKGYRRLVSELVKNPQYRNNPFRYLIQKSGEGDDDSSTVTPRIIEEAELGKPYAASSPDRELNGSANYFYYSNLDSKHQSIYDSMLSSIMNFETELTVQGCSMDEMKVISLSILYDHPELFWYKTFGMAGTKVVLYYGATKAESDLLQKKIDTAVAKYLEGIDDSMSAYDVAIRMHAKIISSVDYDTIALEREKSQGGPDPDKIDYLRTICGVFINGKAVCEGYARALQYLLQKCGVECAEAAGNIIKDDGSDGGGHAWNIVKIDGDYYYIDTTWDDSSNTVQSVKKNDLGFDYFCITTEELTRTRDLTLSPVELPSCAAVKANYYAHNGLIIDSYDIDRLKSIAQAAAENGCKLFTFKCKTKALFDEALENLCKQGKDCYDVLKSAAKKNNKIAANGFSYTYDDNIWTITIFFKLS